jgi:hypothetical protein
MAIAELMVGQQNYAFDAASRQAFHEYLALRMTQPHFANARSVRNALDRASSCARRTASCGGRDDRPGGVDAHRRRRHPPEPRLSGGLDSA